MEISKKEITINGSGSMPLKYSFPYSMQVHLLYGDVSTKVVFNGLSERPPTPDPDPGTNRSYI